jgi:hypothetical protein
MPPDLVMARDLSLAIFRGDPAGADTGQLSRQDPRERVMTRIADLLDHDFSRPIEEIEVDNDDRDTVFTELTEYIATDRIKAEYERLLSAMAAAPKSPNEGVGVWISGLFGSGKSSFVKNLGYVLANREVLGASASSLFLKQVESKRAAECVEFLNRGVPYEIFMFDVQVEVSTEAKVVQTGAEQVSEVMYRVLLRDLDYAQDYDISELEIELEKAGRLAAFQDLCRAEYREEWRKIRIGNQNLARSSALLHRLDPRTYASTDTWLDIVMARPPRKLGVKDLVERMFDLCELRRHGKSFAFIMDEVGQYAALNGERLENLCAVVEQFGKQGLARLKAGKIPGPAWIVVTAQEDLQDVYNRLPAGRIAHHELADRFKLRIDLSGAVVRESAARRVLRKKESQESILRKLFQERGASLMENIKLERCARRTEFDENQFVRFYPYLPHLIDLSIEIVAGIRLHPNAPKLPRGSNRSIVKQSYEMLVSDRTRLADQPVGALVSLDKIYDLVEGNMPPAKRKDVLDIRERFDGDKDYPGMAARVAKALCLMEFAKTDLPRTTKNIAALLVQRVTEAPPVLAVAAILYHMKEALFVRWTEDGWKLYDFDELRRRPDAVAGFKNAVGAVNPRLPGWHNDLIQLIKKCLQRGLGWYTRPLQEFTATVSRSLDEIVWALDHLSLDMVDRLSANMVALDRLSMDIVAIAGRLEQSDKRSATLAESIEERLELLHEAVAGLQKTANPEAPAGRVETDWATRSPADSRFRIDADPRNDRTTYIIGLFGTGRRYVNELITQNIGERAKYFRDTIRLHPGPTPMIYSGHATIKHVCRNQELPAVMRQILEAVGSRFADLIFVYRHPLDSLLTNWIWWRTFIRDYKSISGISQIYKNTDELCVDLDQNFLEFKSFADGDPEFFTGAPGQPFLSFPEFVEETELHLQSATVTLRLEDFAIDPVKEFSKIVEVMSVDPDLSRLCVAPPITKPYGHLAVKDKVPRFRSFIDGLNAETKRRIEKIGYNAGS